MRLLICMLNVIESELIEREHLHYTEREREVLHSWRMATVELKKLLTPYPRMNDG